jgi:hypothetical protein
MRTRKAIALGFIGLVIVLLAGWYAVNAANSYMLTSRVIASGGGSLKSGSYSLNGTIGQPEAGQVLANGNYSLRGGFWRNGYQVIFLPVITR